MKKALFVLTAAMFCLAACDKQEVPAPKQDNQDDVYEIVLNEIDTKGSAPVSVDLQMGANESRTLTATLKKNGSPVSGATYSWTDAKIGNYYSGETKGTYDYQYKITALKAGSGSYISVTGYDGGKARATSVNIPINVTDKPSASLERISLTLTSSTIYAGMSTTATVTAYYSDGTSKDVTLECSFSYPSHISVNGATVSSIKETGCLGDKDITVSYQGLSDSATLTVKTDFTENHFVLSVYEHYTLYDPWPWSEDILPEGTYTLCDKLPEITLNGYANYLENGITKNMDRNSSYLKLDSYRGAGTNIGEEKEIWTLTYLGQRICGWTLIYVPKED